MWLFCSQGDSIERGKGGHVTPCNPTRQHHSQPSLLPTPPGSSDPGARGLGSGAWALGGLYEWVRLQGHTVLDLLGLERRGQLQGQQGLHHAVTVMGWWGALRAGALLDVSTVEKVVALLDEGLDDRLVELGG